MTRPTEAHAQSAAAARLHPPAAPWGRPLAWWRAAAALAPALPLGLVADLGALLDGALPLAGDEDAYAEFLHAAARTPAVATAQSLRLNDSAIVALLAYLAQGAPIPAEYREQRTGDEEQRRENREQGATHHSPLVTHHSSLTTHLLERLRALSAADVRFVAELGQGVLGVAALADLRALTELLSLPSMSHSLIEEVLAFLPALAESAPGAALQTYAVDGYGGLARSGPLDALLPSEWALPPLLLHSRYLNGELLYYGRERPPEQRNTLLLVLLQLSDALAGDLEPLVKASALALARAAQARGASVQVATFDTRLHPPQPLARPAEVAALVRQQGRGRADLARVLPQVQAQVCAAAAAYSRIELVWLLHAQTGSDQVGAITTLARSLRSQAGSRALFLSAGRGVAQPRLAGILTEHWASVGSTALHEAEERAKAVHALRGLARPSERERLRVEPPPTPRRRIVATPPLPPPDPVIALLAAAHWDDALAALEPRARQGDPAALCLLATLIEGPHLRPPSTSSPPASSPPTSSPLNSQLSPPASSPPASSPPASSPPASSPPASSPPASSPLHLPPLATRRAAAALLATLGDPRLLDPLRGDAPLGGYWCDIEAGPLWFGDDTKNEALREVRLPYAYRIARYLVTNAEYRRFIEAGGYQERRWWTENGWQHKNRYTYTQPRLWDNERYNQPTQPVVGVAWWEAAAYCAWLSATGQAAGWLGSQEELRLPTSLEWERAARGSDQRRYPWGDAPPDGERANYKETGIGQPTPVGCFPAGAAGCGALDMAGNVMEWLSTPFSAPTQQAAQKEFTPNEGVVVTYADFRDNSAQLCCGARFWDFPASGASSGVFGLSGLSRS